MPVLVILYKAVSKEQTMTRHTKDKNMNNKTT